MTEAHVNLAEMCVISPCVRNYKIAVSYGLPVVDVLDTDYGFIQQASVVQEVIEETEPANWTELCWQGGPGNFTYEDAAHLVGYKTQLEDERVNATQSAFVPEEISRIALLSS